VPLFYFAIINLNFIYSFSKKELNWVYLILIKEIAPSLLSLKVVLRHLQKSGKIVTTRRTYTRDMLLLLEQYTQYHKLL